MDEVNSLPFDMQVKFLRVLQEKSICRIGGSNNVQLHIKVIAASNEDLWELVQKGGFRADLFYRLNVITVHIPPLRHHVDDIPEIAQRIIDRIAPGAKQVYISEDAYDLLMSYHWPGNIRELENAIERGLVNARLRGESCICALDIESAIQSKNMQTDSRNLEFTIRTQHVMKDHAGVDFPRITDGEAGTLDALNQEKQRILDCLKAHGGNVSATARALGIARNTLYQKMYKYGINMKKY